MPGNLQRSMKDLCSHWITARKIALLWETICHHEISGFGSASMTLETRGIGVGGLTSLITPTGWQKKVSLDTRIPMRTVPHTFSRIRNGMMSHVLSKRRLLWSGREKRQMPSQITTTVVIALTRPRWSRFTMPWSPVKAYWPTGISSKSTNPNPKPRIRWRRSETGCWCSSRKKTPNLKRRNLPSGPIPETVWFGRNRIILLDVLSLKL